MTNTIKVFAPATVLNVNIKQYELSIRKCATKSYSRF